MKKSILLGVLLCCLFTGCEADTRIKRASSLSVTKAEVAKAEFEAAKTPEDANKVAKDYFDTAPALLRAVDDYTHGREPAENMAPPTTPK